jgi:spore photoproduct lyase
MIYIVCALLDEARPLIDFYKLKHNRASKFSLYENKTIKLTLSGIGKIKSAIATTNLLQNIKNDDIVINIGLCATTNTHPIGTTLLIHQIIDPSNKRSYYPEIYYEHPFVESALTSFDQLVTTPHATAVDMEASGFFEATNSVIGNDRIALFKIVSDHFEKKSFAQNEISLLIEKNIPKIDTLLQKIVSNSQTKKALLTQEESQHITSIYELFKLSQTQFHQLQTTYIEAKHGLSKSINALKIFDVPIPKNKKEKSELFNTLLQKLKNI